jgi:basic membrane protein A
LAFIVNVNIQLLVPEEGGDMIISKRLLAAGVVAALALAACGDDDDSAPAATTEAPAATTAAPATTAAQATTAPGGGEGAKVALLFDITCTGDKSFNDSAAAGLEKATADFGITASHSCPTGDDDRKPRLDLAVQDGNQLIIGVGFLWGPAISAGAFENPDTHFGIVDSVVNTYDANATPDDTSDDVALTNVASLVFAEEQGSYLVGAAAALTSKSGTIGFVGGVEIDLIKKFEAGYIAGAKAVNPDITILSKYISQPPDFTGFNNAAAGKEVAAQMYADGADVVYHAAGATGLGVFQAAKEAGAPGETWAIGVDSDQYLTASPDLQPYILTSMVKHVDVSVYETIKAETEGTFTGDIQVFDLARDGVGYATSGDFLSAETIATIEDYKAKIISGEITVPTDPTAA